MNAYYVTSVSIAELGTSDHSMLLWKPDGIQSNESGSLTRVTVKCMGPTEKAAFAMALSLVNWDPLFRLNTCEEKYAYYHTMINNLMEMCFPCKIVTRHTADKPWITDWFINLIRNRQRVHMSGDVIQARMLRNRVNRAAVRLKCEFY